MKINVQKYPKPILSPGIFSGNIISSDALWVYHPVIVQKKARNEFRYYMLYTGKGIGFGIEHHTLLAVSKDLRHWKKTGNIVLPNGKEGEWDSDFTAHGFVFGERKKFTMLYDGSRTGDWLEEIGLAESSDLFHWKKDKRNPIFRVGISWWEKRHVSRCIIYKRNGTHFLYYAGHDGQRERIGLATGKTITGINKRLPYPALDVGAKGAWDERSISDPRVIAWKGKYIMFYSGIDARGIERTGVAESRNLMRWKKYARNPVLDVTDGGWDSISASRAFPFVEENRITLFYSGRRNYFYQIGQAEVSIV